MTGANQQKQEILEFNEKFNINDLNKESLSKYPV